ncbi:hypothetical protein HBH68_097880 [Parastagonospora nodorum]|nr:hypothetical protein HBH68_097880 [Parastagonospora nodorum]KAH5674783.1 hypothetical protein HBI21_133650 [Parastagonospora nodorum]KAH6068301.1 hypothetical protein HBI67_104540 [Parastagonospora nodorum]
MMKLKLLVIPASWIAEDNAAVQASQETANPLSRSQRFNTKKHTQAEIEEAIPDSNVQHANPPWMPYSYTLWHSLIAKSQGLATSHVLKMPSVLCDDLMLLHCSWLRSGRFPSYLLNPLVEDLKSSRTGRKLMSLLDGKQRWFIRLDQMSPKDSPLGGDRPSTTIQEVITKIASSMRAYGNLQWATQAEERPWGENRANVQLILNPWNDKMDPAREFRVFVPPPPFGAQRKRWRLPYQCDQSVPLAQAPAIAARVYYRAARRLCYDGRTENPDFDVVLQDDGSVQLVELNPFGAMSGCGACLFNWIIDARMLYGLEDAGFAIVLDEPM